MWTQFHVWWFLSLKQTLQPIGVKLFLQINKISILSSKHWVCFMASNHLKHLSLYMASNHFRESGFRHSFLTSHKLINLHDNSLTASCRFLHYLIEESHSFIDLISMFLHYLIEESHSFSDLNSMFLHYLIEESHSFSDLNSMPTWV